MNDGEENLPGQLRQAGLSLIFAIVLARQLI